MRSAAMALLALGLAACDAGRPLTTPYIMAASADFTRSAGWYEEGDIADDARAFLFTQAALHEFGANPEAGGQLAEMLALMGREDLIRPAAFEAGLPRCAAPPPEPVDHVRQAARDVRAVILIEEGSQPRHRAFLMPLVAGLAEDGFTAYAADALSAGAGRAAFPGIPLITEGVLARDPVYGRLLRQVKAHGLDLIEGDGGWAPPSELAGLTPEGHAARRAEVLAARLSVVFAESDDARVLLHLSRHPGEAALARLEAQLEAASGRAPLTIQMADCAPPGTPRALLPEAEDEIVSTPDIRIGEPVAAFRNGRPTWRRQLGDREIAVPAAFLSQDQTVIVEVRREGETPLAVPEDRLMLRPGEALPLMLPPGRYRIEAWTRNGPLAAPVPFIVS
ncbi:MAG: hypothetical protein ACK46Q_08120 [Hyphomonas sp.]